MHKAYKFRLYPTKEQETIIAKSIGCNRFVYNHFLAKRKEAYEEYDTTINYNGCSALLTKLKKEFPWQTVEDAINEQLSPSRVTIEALTAYSEKSSV